VLLYAALQMWRTGSQGGDREIGRVRAFSRGTALALGAGIGLLAGLTGVGGGTFLSPLLLFYGWANAKTTAAVSAPFVFVNSALALLVWFGSNPVSYPDYTGWLLAAVIVGGLAGAHSGARRFASTHLRRLLALLPAIAGAKLVAG